MFEADDPFEIGRTIFMSAIPSAMIAGVATVLLVVVVPLAAGVHLPRPETPRALADERLRAELAVAEEIGFTRSEEIPLRDLDQTHAIELRDDECVAVVATEWGAHRIDWIAIGGRTEDDEHHALARDVFVPGVVGHAQVCPARRRVFVRVESTRGITWGGEPTFGTLVILRGPADHVRRRLNRGEVARWLR